MPARSTSTPTGSAKPAPVRDPGRSSRAPRADGMGERMDLHRTVARRSLLAGCRWRRPGPSGRFGPASVRRRAAVARSTGRESGAFGRRRVKPPTFKALAPWTLPEVARSGRSRRHPVNDPVPPLKWAGRVSIYRFEVPVSGFGCLAFRGRRATTVPPQQRKAIPVAGRVHARQRFRACSPERIDS